MDKQSQTQCEPCGTAGPGRDGTKQRYAAESSLVSRHRRRSAPLLTVWMLAIAPALTLASTLHVDINSINPVEPYVDWGMAATNIQDAINEAADMDVILVAGGVYRVSAPVLIDKGITVRGASEAAAACIDGSGSNRCVYINHTNAVLDGLSVQNGKVSDSGGGVYAEVSCAIINCTIASNTAHASGGGIFLENGGSVSNCIVRENTVELEIGLVGGYGGGIYCNNGGSLMRCTIVSNRTVNGGSPRGGGVYLKNGGTLIECAVLHNRMENTVSGNGAGLYSNSGSTQIAHCEIKWNRCIGTGVGLWLAGAVRVSDTLICGNNGNDEINGGSGGGARITSSDGTYIISDCTVCCNTNNDGGGTTGRWCWSGRELHRIQQYCKIRRWWGLSWQRRHVVHRLSNYGQPYHWQGRRSLREERCYTPKLHRGRQLCRG